MSRPTDADLLALARVNVATWPPFTPEQVTEIRRMLTPIPAAWSA